MNRGLMLIALFIGMVSISPTHAGARWSAGLEIELGDGEECVDCGWEEEECDDDRHLEKTICRWKRLPSGRWVMKCRKAYFDARWDEWSFGPWWIKWEVCRYCCPKKYHHGCHHAGWKHHHDCRHKHRIAHGCKHYRDHGSCHHGGCNVVVEKRYYGRPHKTVHIHRPHRTVTRRVQHVHKPSVKVKRRTIRPVGRSTKVTRTVEVAPKRKKRTSGTTVTTTRSKTIVTERKPKKIKRRRVRKW
ncbi:MAG: hypothetical protein GF398_17695 [Chitinivibrionales bacterium]|nr:hypothetical protein [Chitinivibrionales bacterium]